MIRTHFAESKSVGYRQLRAVAPNQEGVTYFQDFNASEGWYRVSDGSRVTGNLETFICEQVAAHKKRKADRLADIDNKVALLTNG
jgi:hypothetical protein